MHYVQLKRMEHAKRQLSYSNFSISDIAEQVSMELAHFSKYFKKTIGISLLPIVTALSKFIRECLNLCDEL